MAGISDRDGKIKTALITGKHLFSVEDLQGFFRSIPEIDCYPQHMEDYVTDPSDPEYDVLAFYNLHWDPPDPNDKLGAKTIEVFERLGETSTGMVIFHNGVLAYRGAHETSGADQGHGWQVWNDMVGMPDRSSRSDPEHPLSAKVINTGHPITKAMPSFELLDETYNMPDADPTDGNEVLITTKDPMSTGTLLWTRMWRSSRVMCTPLGHSRKGYNTPQFRQIMVRGIQWVAGRI